jgi:hypothetical protein
VLRDLSEPSIYLEAMECTLSAFDDKSESDVAVSGFLEQAWDDACCLPHACEETVSDASRMVPVGLGSISAFQTEALGPKDGSQLSFWEGCEDPEMLVFGAHRTHCDEDHGNESSSSLATSEEGSGASSPSRGRKRSVDDEMDAKKLDEKKRRNCIAARECRAKKKRTYQALQYNHRELEIRYSQLRIENESLKSINAALEKQLCFFQV